MDRRRSISCVAISLILFLGLEGCGRRSTSHQTEFQPPATPQVCDPEIKDQLKATRKVLDAKATDGSVLRACDRLKALAPAGARDCLFKDDSRLSIAAEIDECTAIENQVQSKDQTQSVQQGPPLVENAADQVESELKIGLPVYIPNLDLFGQVGTNDNGDQVVVTQFDPEKKTKSVVRVSKLDILMPLKNPILKACGQDVDVKAKPLAIDSQRTVYRVLAVFPNGQIWAEPQAFPSGFSRVLRFQYDLKPGGAPIKIDVSEISGLEVDCSSGICQGQRVLPANGDSPPLTLMTAEHIFCNGTITVLHSTPLGAFQTVESLKDFVLVPAPVRALSKI